MQDESSLLDFIKISKSPALFNLLSKNIPIEEVLEVGRKAQKIDSTSTLISNDDALRILEEIKKQNILVITIKNPAYPRELKSINNPPPILYTRGNIGLLQNDLFSIVGARNASLESMKIAENFAVSLSRAGFTIVSGFANGIDTSACCGALKYGTVQVLGSGVNVIYPRQNQRLYKDVLDAGGIFISELPPNAPAKPEHFPLRNRIISGISKGVLLVQGSMRNGSSGSLITAKIALEQGRDLFAIPGHPLDSKFNGGNELIKYGSAIFTTCPEDIIDFLSHSVHTRQSIELFKIKFNEVKQAKVQNPLNYSNNRTTEEKIKAILGTKPVSADEISNIIKIDPKQVQISLAGLELLNQVQRHKNGKFSLSLL